MGCARQKHDPPLKRRSAAAILCALAMPLAGCSVMLERSAREAVKAELSDPASAQFRDMHTYKLSFSSTDVTPPMTPGGNSVCGAFNARNRLGGYVGFRHFIFDATSGAVIIEPDPFTSAMDIEDIKRLGAEGLAFSKRWGRSCGTLIL